MSNLIQFKPGVMLYRGAYSAATTYVYDDVVTYLGTVYLCLVNGTRNILPTVTNNWDPIVVPKSLAVSTTGTGTNPATFTLTTSGGTVTLNKVA